VLEHEKLEQRKKNLTYKTVPKIENNYQFVLTKAMVGDDLIESRIEHIILQKK
jgi:hypothetical protein